MMKKKLSVFDRVSPWLNKEKKERKARGGKLRMFMCEILPYFGKKQQKTSIRY
jgi:hypothetical protein